MVAPSNTGIELNGVKSDQILFEKTDPRPITQIAPPAIRAIFLRDAPSLSMRRETTDSSIDIEVLSAANKTRSKKSVPTKIPPGI